MRIPFILLALLAVAACSSTKNDGQAPLAFVPADTAYVFANLEPVKPEVFDAYGEMMAPMQSAYADLLSKLRAEFQNETDLQARERGLAVLDLAEDKLTIEGWEKIGFRRDSRTAFYGVGLLPVMRIELGDPERLRAFMTELEQKIGMPLPTAEIEGQHYWRFTPEADKPFAIVVAIIGEHLVITLDAGPEIVPLAQLLGLPAPAQSLQDSEELTALNRDYGFGPYGTFLLDNRRVLAALLGAEGEQTWFTRLLAEQGEAIAAECRSEFAGMVENAPRIVGGYSLFDANGMDARTVIELKSSLTQALAPLAAPVPGLGSHQRGPALDFGFGIKLDKLAEFIQAQASAIRATPYRCEMLAALNQGADQVGQQMAGLYMAAGWFTGLRAVVTELSLDPDTMKPDRLQGAMVLASPNPASLIGMLKGFVPQLAAIDLQPGGAPQPLDLAGMAGADAGDMPPSWAAMTDQAIGLGFGEGAGDRLAGYLGEPAAAVPPLLHFSYQGALYGQLMRQFQKFSEARTAAALESEDADEATDAEGKARKAEQAKARERYRAYQRVAEEFMDSVYAIYEGIDYTSTSLIIGDRGLEMQQVMRLKR